MDDPELLRELAGMLVEVTGEDRGWAATITPETRLEDDLGLESVELAAFGELLRGRYGDRVDLTGHVAGLDLDQLIALRVRDVMALVSR